MAAYRSANQPLLKEFRPSLFFIAKFIGLYLVLNLLYGIYVESFDQADPITSWVSEKSSGFINLFGAETQTYPHESKSTIVISNEKYNVLSVYEGCNGFNVAIVFLAFLLSFPSYSKKLLWFIPVGIVLIHILNLGRIGLLYWVTLNQPKYLYFTHKYFFTAILFILVFFLWYIWVTKINPVVPKVQPQPSH